MARTAFNLTRGLHVVLGILMGLFAAVQVNDPDSLPWMLAYGGVCLWMLLLAWQPALRRRASVNALLIASVLGMALATVLLWPQAPGWWRQDVWWETETAREGMGMMIATLVLSSAFLAGRGVITRQTPVVDVA